MRILSTGHDCKEDNVRSNTSDLNNTENYSNGIRNVGDAGDAIVSEQRNLRHNSRNLKSGNGNGAAGDNSSNDSSDDEDDEDDEEEEEEDDDMLTTSSDENDVYSKTSKNNNGTNIKRTNQKRTSTIKSTAEHSIKKSRRSSALSIDLNVADASADAH